jgi:enoyl-CoA hydratase/carnithine racemase
MYQYEKKYDHVVKYEKDNMIATITLDCPQNMNRVSEQLIDELTEALKQANWDSDVRVVVLRGSGEISFGPGDLEIIKAKLGKNLQVAREVMVEIGNMLKLMYSMTKPIIGVAEGGCMGGGCNILLSSDIVIASEISYFHELFVNFALSPDSGGLWALQRLVGPMKAKAICMCGD